MRASWNCRGEGFDNVLRRAENPAIPNCFIVHQNRTDDNKHQWRIEERNDWKALLESMQTDRTVLQQQTARLKVKGIITRLGHLVLQDGERVAFLVGGGGGSVALDIAGSIALLLSLLIFCVLLSLKVIIIDK